MANNPRKYKPSTVRRLDTLSGTQCAAPYCQNVLIARDGETIISKICHIEAAKKYGPRYNSDMTVDDRRHYNNLILLCDACHRIIDNIENEDKYPVSLLKEWKETHETKTLNKRNVKPSLLIQAINAIADVEFSETEIEKDDKTKPFKIKDKIEYNDVRRNRSLIDKYKVYYAKVNSIYKELELQGSFKKTKLLRNISTLYQKIKGRYIGGSANPMQVIRDNADNIIEDVEEALLECIEKDGTHHEDDIIFELSIIMVDAFIMCKILEEPPGK